MFGEWAVLTAFGLRRGISKEPNQNCQEKKRQDEKRFQPTWRSPGVTLDGISQAGVKLRCAGVLMLKTKSKEFMISAEIRRKSELEPDIMA